MSVRLSDVVFLIRKHVGDQPALINELRELEKRLSKPKRGYERSGIYQLNDVLQYVPDDPKKGDVHVFDGDEIKMDSLRYQVFKKSLVCVKCGLVGEFFAKEITICRNNNKPKDKATGEEFDRWHFNLYAMKDGKEVIMTKDHVKPLSKGGSNSLSNLQTMCGPCNWRKGSKYVQNETACD